ncbi:hypothetical protein ACFVY4_26880 [Streptomyces sp. NPDC058299]|uniref:hypothetical protein n=1 Tax=Streptomyces sp. NPDC058299 TaxID=3346435 RepID=UPI0036E80B4A
MVKGQAIGGQANGQRRRGGMLPPTGAGPVEVTPEWLEEQKRVEAEANGTAPVPAPAETHAADEAPAPAEGAQAPAGTPVLAQPPAAPAIPAQAEEAVAVPKAPPLPDPAAPKAEQLAVCERAIHAAKARRVARIEGAEIAFYDEAGPYLGWVHQHKLYKEMRDNSGKPYRSFPKYLKEQHGLTERTGYRITQTLPLLRILAAFGWPLPDLSARTVERLHPVRIKHGEDAVVKVWRSAWETKKGPLPTPDELDKAKQLLGFTTKADADDEAPKELKAADPGAALERAAKLLVPENVRAAVQKDPDRVRLLHRILGQALEEAGLNVD